MKYELKYGEFSTEKVDPEYGDILVLHTDDGGKVVVLSNMSSDGLTCSKCRLSDRAGEYPRINCSLYNFRCPIASSMYFTSIDTILEDL